MSRNRENINPKNTKEVSQLLREWKDVLDLDKNAEVAVDAPSIRSREIRKTMAVLLENQNLASQGQEPLFEDLHESVENNMGDLNTNVKIHDPVMISMVRRAAPQMVAFDVCGVQAMTQPTGLVFALNPKYGDGDATLTDDPNALFDEADTDFGGTGTHAGSDPAVLNESVPGTYTTGTGMTLAAGEILGTSTGGDFGTMGFTIEKVSVTARTRALRAEFTEELRQDLRSVHGLDAEQELANILSQEILFEQNREILRTIYTIAEIGAQTGTANAGTFDLDVDSNGRWLVEKFKGLMFQLEREANQIAKRTRRGKANIMIVSSDVASALVMAGQLDYAPAIKANLEVDDMGNTFAGVLNGRYKVYIDPYLSSSAGNEFAVVGYKGSTSWDSGLYFCPYVPLIMSKVTSFESHQPSIAFKTRYALTCNPFANSTGTQGALVANANRYYRKIRIRNLL